MDLRFVWRFEHKTEAHSALAAQAQGYREGDQGFYFKRADKNREPGFNQEF